MEKFSFRKVVIPETVASIEHCCSPILNFPESSEKSLVFKLHCALSVQYDSLSLGRIPPRVSTHFRAMQVGAVKRDLSSCSFLKIEDNSISLDVFLRHTLSPCTYARVLVCLVCACVRACVRACVCVCARVWVYLV